MYEKYRTMDQRGRDQEMGLEYFKLVEAEEIPSGKDMQRLKVSCKEGKPLSGDKVCEKGRQVKQVILRDHNTVWRKLFPNGCPSGVSLAEAKYRFMLAMHRRQEEQRKGTSPPLDESAGRSSQAQGAIPGCFFRLWFARPLGRKAGCLHGGPLLVRRRHAQGRCGDGQVFFSR